MSNEVGDDQIIATAFRRSVAVIVFIALVAAIVLGTKRLLREQASDPDDAELIAPRTVNLESNPNPPAARFTDVTESAGITHAHRNGAYGDRLLPETMGGGVAFLDYNDDQAVDLLFVNGRTWPWREPLDDTRNLFLYRGDGSGRFSDVSDSLPAGAPLYGMGAAVGDYDGDGDVDVFVTALGANRLLRNVEGQRFEDVTEVAGVAGADDAWSTGAAFVDYDRDQDLDLVVLNYVQWSRDIDFEVDYRLTGIGRAYGPPTQYAGTYSYIYNNDNGRFSDVSVEAGIQVDNPTTGLPLGKGLAVLPTDVDADGWMDLVVANDTVRNFLFENNAQGGFEERGVGYGIAFDNSGVATGAMGIDDAMLVATGRSSIAIAIGNFANEMTSFYVRAPQARIFTDQAIVTGVGPASRQALTFGLFFFDYDLDGRLDLLQANGHVENDITVVQPSQRYAQQPQLFWNCGDACTRQFIPVELQNDLSHPIIGRGAAYADIDMDGDQDVILTQIGRPPKLLRNDQNSGHNWIQFDVLNKAGARSYGATVEIVTGEEHQRRRVEPTRSYLSQVETTVSFGIGNHDRVDSVVVRWPDGQSLELENPEINRRHRIAADSAQR